MKDIHVRKKMLYILLIPYLVAGMAAAVFFGCKYRASVREIRETYYEENHAVLNKINREIDYLVNDIDNLVVEIELNDRFTRLLMVPKTGRSGTDNYSIAMGLRDLRNIKKYNHLIEDVILYYRKGDFFLNPLSLRTEKGIYEDYADNYSVPYEEWTGALTGEFSQGRLVLVGDAIYYIVTIPFNEEEENCNVIVKVASKGFYELLNDYNMMNESGVYLYNYDMSPVTTNTIAGGIPLNEAEVLAAVGSGTGMADIDNVRIGEDEYAGVRVKSESTGLTYLLLTKYGILKDRIRLVTFLYLGGGLLFGLLLFLGLYGIAVIYRNIQLIIKRLVWNNGKEAGKSYSEFDYINGALTAMEEKMQVQENAVLDSCIRKAIYGLTDEEDSNYRSLVKSHERLCCGQSMIAIFEHSMEEERDPKEVKLDLFIIGNVLRDVFQESVESWVIPVYNWEIVALNWCGDGEMETDYVLGGLEKTRQFLEEYLDLRYTVGVSLPAAGIQGFAGAYKEAMDAVEEKQVLGDGRVIFCGRLKEERRSFEYTDTMEKQLQNYIRLGDKKKAEELIEMIYDQAFHQNPISLEAGKLLLLDLIKTVNETAAGLECGVQVEAAGVLKKKYTANGMKKNILDAINLLCDQRTEQVDSVENRKTQIKQYIENHYGNADLNVAMIAEAFHLNSSYLSRFFKEETGDNLLNYINRYRVDRVKELLLSTEKTVTAISGETGFLNAAALTRTFKKYEGITPGQYKAAHRGENITL